MSHQNRYTSRQVGIQVHKERPNSQSPQPPSTHPKGPSYDENNPKFKSDVERASILSRINFFYVIPLIIRAWKINRKGQELTDKDLVTFPYKNRAEVFEENYMKRIRRQQKKPESHINSALAVLLAIKWKFFLSVSRMIGFCFLRIFSAWVTKKLLESYLNPETATTDSYWWAAILAGVLLLALYVEHHWNSVTMELSAYTKAGIISMLYNKVIRLSTYNITKLSPGQLINIVTNDTSTIEILFFFFPAVIGAIFNLIAGTALLWTYFGVTCLLGVGYIALTIPLQILLANKTLKMRRDRNLITDMRVTRTRETIQDIRLLKMYTWELKFQDNILQERKKDVAIMNRVLFWESIARGLGWSTQAMAAFLIFMLYYVTGGDLTIPKAFSAYFVLGIMRLFTAYFIYGASNFVAETGLLFKRINKIMETPDMSELSFPAPVNLENSIEFENYNGYWTKNEAPTPSRSQEVALEMEKKKNSPKEAQAALTNINLNLKKGSLNSIVGSVGSGKSSLLLSFTNELPETTGQLRYKGSIAYVEQEPTIFAGTVRESILFGKEYNEEFYKKVIKACNLESDLKLFPQGDMSMIGERGNNLSGGQKARLALARAVYADADIYLLDDPLSAVDAKVAHSIYHDAILGLLKEKTVILVTHQVHFVRDSEMIIVMDEGKVIGSGTFDQLKEQGVDVNTIFSVEKKESEEISEGSPESRPTLQEVQLKNNKQNEDEVNGKKQEEVTEDTPKNEEDQKEDTAEGLAPSSNVDPYAGKVSLKTYGLLIKEIGLGLTFFLVILYVFTEFGNVAFGRILGTWTAGRFDLGESLGALGGIAGYLIFMTILKNIVFTYGIFGAAQRYHNKMLDKVIKSPVSFFDTNPVGRILNRFSNDLGVVDKFFPQVFLDVTNIFSFVLGVAITLSILNPILLGPICGAFCAIVLAIVFYFPAIKLAKRYDLNTRGPLFSLFSASMSGVAIIRNYRQTENFKNKFRAMLYTNTKGNINFYFAAKLLGFCVDASYNLAAIGIVYINTANINPDEGASSGALAAFTVALALSLAGVFQHGVKQFCQGNILMSSAARIQSYCDLPSEAALSIPEDNEYKKKQWPQKGDIEFNKVYMKYRPELDYVIKDLNLLVDSGEKIGCVGRTGAGKSTIINLLFRLQEIDRTHEYGKESFIKIDNTDIQPLGLHLLRGNISIIPQTPFIFVGTIKENIDPIGEFSDEQIWSALEEVRLKDHVAKLSDKLETNMNNASSVFSVGQKQLVCLARTLLKPCKLLVLDEATANMDSETDSFIQNKIMERFSSSTVFTIAHRLATIANYDKVLVLDKGRKVEFDEPYNLLVNNVGDDSLTNTNGHFGSMVVNTGHKASQRILNITKETYNKKHSK